MNLIATLSCCCLGFYISRSRRVPVDKKDDVIGCIGFHSIA